MPTAISVQSLRDRNLGQVDILHHRPDNSQTTGLSGERVNLIGALSDIAKETLDGIGAANLAMHDRREGVKCQQMLFIFDQAADGFWIALLVFGFEGG